LVFLFLLGSLELPRIHWLVRDSNLIKVHCSRFTPLETRVSTLFMTKLERDLSTASRVSRQCNH
jgi:hypothetical protein